LDLEEIGCAEVLMGIGKYQWLFCFVESFLKNEQKQGFFNFVLLAAKVM
jgi:hypothetical protein